MTDLHGYIVFDHTGEEYARTYAACMEEALDEAAHYLDQLSQGGFMRRLRSGDNPKEDSDE